MMILHVLLIAIMMNCGVVFGMEKETLGGPVGEFELAEQLQCLVFTKNGNPDLAISGIRNYAKDHVKLIRVLNNKKGAEQVLDFVGDKCPCFWRENAGIGCRDRQSFHKELAAALLGTPGAIEFAKEYVQKDDQATKRLRTFLFDIVRYGHEPNFRGDGFTFENEGVDIIKAGLDILSDTNIKNDLLVNAACREKVKTVKLLLDRGADIEATLVYEAVFPTWEKQLDETKKYTALCAAVKSEKNHAMVDLLLARGANVNAIDNCGRTPLILAAMAGNVESVTKLLEAKAVVWLLDGYDKIALDYAQEGLLGKNRDNYEKIIQLLKSAQ